MAKKFNDSVADGLCAATEGLRMLVSDAATVGPEDEGQFTSLMINDVSRPKKEQTKTMSDPSP